MIDKVARRSKRLLADTVALAVLLRRDAELVGDLAVWRRREASVSGLPGCLWVSFAPIGVRFGGRGRQDITYSISSTVSEPMVSSSMGPMIVPSWLATGNRDGRGPDVGGGRAGHEASTT